MIRRLLAGYFVDSGCRQIGANRDKRLIDLVSLPTGRGAANFGQPEDPGVAGVFPAQGLSEPVAAVIVEM
jgi:hypothetical protein